VIVSRATTAQIMMQVGSVGTSSQAGDFLTVLFSQPRSQVVPLDRLSQFMAQTTCFRKRCFFRNRTI